MMKSDSRQVIVEQVFSVSWSVSFQSGLTPGHVVDRSFTQQV